VVWIDDATVAEGNGDTIARFTVHLTDPSDLPVTIEFATTDVTALAGQDYVATAGTLTFEPGETTKTIDVVVRGDLLDEYTETFRVILDSPTNASLSDGQATGAITNDDPTPSLTIADVTQAEGSSGSAAMTFTLRLSAPSGKDVAVYFRTDDGTARAGSDYVSTYGFYHFAVGQAELAIAVPVLGDTRDEATETFGVRSFHPSNVVIADGQAVGTILDDDSPPTLTIGDVTQAEGRSGASYFVFTVTLSAATDLPVTVSFSTASGTARSGEDYVAAAGTVTFAPGQTTKTILIQVKGDRKKESHETFFVNLGGVSGAILGDRQGRGTIINDD
jgi:hypothetical protein